MRVHARAFPLALMAPLLVKWSAERDALLTRLRVEEGKSAQQIADLMAISRSAVLGRARRLALPLAQGREPKPAPQPRKPPSQPRKPPAQPRSPVSLPPKPLPHAPPPTSEGIALVDLKPATCRWPLGDWSTPADDLRFCGTGPTEPNSSYCPYHHRVAIRRVDTANPSG